MKKVLFIEDDLVLRENTAEILELASYQVFTASNGEIGLRLAKEVKPDIIICDIMMPVLDGYQVLDALAQAEDTKHIPFIFLSAKTERQDVRKGMNFGADDYITKPFNEDEIISAIESRIAKVELLREGIAATNREHLSSENELESINDLKNFFDDNGKAFSYEKNEIIHSEQDHSNHIYLVLKGIVRCYKFDENGKELTTALYNADDLFGFSSFTQNLPYAETAIAMDDTELVGVSKTELKDVLLKNHKVTLEIIQSLTDDITGIKDQLLQMAYSSVKKKTANTILRFAEKINTKPEDSIKISRSDLASIAGIATETFIRTMSDFKKQGLIEMDGRNIKVVDIQKLQEIY